MNEFKKFKNIKKKNVIIREPKKEDFQFGASPRFIGVLDKDYGNGWLRVQTYGPRKKIEKVVEMFQLEKK